jgi:hypothetical protein
MNNLSKTCFTSMGLDSGMNKNYNKYKSLIALAVCSSISSAANAAEFYFGEDNSIELRIASQLSVGASWRLNEIDPRFVSKVNGGTGQTATTDDGNLNFEKGSTFSQIIKGVHDIHLSKDNFGLFARVKYWYDKELKDGSRAHGHSANGYVPGQPLNDDNFADLSKFSGIELFDAYVYAGFEIGDTTLDLRLGKQVISWGESTFIQGGLNSSNPFDVNAFRRPGAELKEALIPVGMAYFNVGLTADLSIEGFYQYEWEKTQIDGCGTFFSGADFAADGCNAVTIAVADQQALAGGFFAKRKADGEPEDGGQYGLSVRYYSTELNDTEFGLYYMNIHSRLPLINAIRTQTLAVPGVDSVFIPSSLDPTGGKLSALNPAYRIVYPEDLKFFGASFATNVGGLALSGEVSYKPDTPVQISGPEILNAVLSEQPFFKFTERLSGAKGVAFGADAKGWDEFDVTQLQITALQFYDRVLGASRVTVIGELGVILTDGVEDSNQNYGRNSVFGVGDFDAGGGINCTNLVAAGAVGGDCRNDGYTTDSAWGYRIRTVAEYPNLIGSISIKPTLDWSHDVSGYSPDPAQQFHEGRKSIGLSVEGSYKQIYSATLGYRSYSGGSHNILEDKDFMSLSFNISY